MIASINLVNLKNAEYLQYIKDFGNILERNDPKRLNVEAKYKTLKTKSEELYALYIIAKANDNTAILADLDNKRDKALMGIKNVIKGYIYHYDEKTRTPAEKIKNSFEVYGKVIGRSNYQSETTKITNLINDWETKPELIEAFKTLDLNAWKKELKKLNETFNEVYLNRTQEYGEASPESLRAKREETNVDYYALRDRINALHTLVETPPSPYELVISQLNALIQQYNTATNHKKHNNSAEGNTSKEESENILLTQR